MKRHFKTYFYLNDDYIGQINYTYKTEYEFFEKTGFIIKKENFRCYDFYNEDRNYSNYYITIRHFNLRKITEHDNDIMHYDYIIMDR